MASHLIATKRAKHTKDLNRLSRKGNRTYYLLPDNNAGIVENAQLETTIIIMVYGSAVMKYTPTNLTTSGNLVESNNDGFLEIGRNSQSIYIATQNF